MGRLRLLPQISIELDGFPLEVGDGIAILLLGEWVSGMIGHDEAGWYLLTKEKRGIRLQTGQMARLLSLGMVPQQPWASMSKRVFSECACSPLLSTSQRLRSSPTGWCGWKEKGFKALRERRSGSSGYGWRKKCNGSDQSEAWFSHQEEQKGDWNLEAPWMQKIG